MNTPAACSLIPGQAQTILVVDDDVQVLKFFIRMLNSLGYREILQASCTDEAVEIFRANTHRIFLVISDFVMPSRTGDQLVLDLLKLKPELHALIISGNDPSSLNSAIPLRPGVNFLQKPFTFGEIHRVVTNLSASA